MINPFLYFNQLENKDPKIKYAFVKLLIKAAGEDPVSVYRHYDKISSLLNSKNNILKWAGIKIIGLVSRVDHEERTKAHLPALFNFLRSGRLVECSHAIFSLSRVALYKPELRARVLEELSLVPTFTFDTPDCLGIAHGKTIDGMDFLVKELREPISCEGLIRAGLQSTWPATRKKAEKLKRRLDKLSVISD